MNIKYIVILVLVVLIILFIRKQLTKCNKPEFFDLNPSFNSDDFFLEYDGNLSGTDVKIDKFDSNVSLNTKTLCIGDTCIDNTNLYFLDTLARKTDTDLSIGTDQAHESDFEHLNKFTKQGLIVPFYYKQASELDNLPNYWKPCNGENGTPDLRDKFIIGASEKVGEQGGQSTVILKEEHLPKHSHDMNVHTSSQSKEYNSNCINDGSLCYAGIDVSNTFNGPVSNDGITIKTSKNNKVQDSLDIMPPYYSLVYIMMI
jgi:microcystin-dependent protein